ALLVAYFGYAYWKKQISTVWTLALLMLVLRFGVNTLLIPYQNTITEKFEDIANIKEILAIADGEPIYLTGDLWREQPTFKIGEQVIFQRDVEYATEFYFMTTYYITRFQAAPLRYQQTPETGNWYVGKTSVATAQRATIFYEFLAAGHPHCLFKLQ
ncbi:MAG: hypothetical protein AAF738_01720, partial [Bacteroidota bacterium]